MPDSRKVGLPADEQIRQRAYEIYVTRGCEDGRDLSDWLQAEQELSEATDDQWATGTSRTLAAVSR